MLKKLNTHFFINQIKKIVYYSSYQKREINKHIIEHSESITFCGVS